jgi:tRNA(Ile)-lysidine synthase
MLEKVKDTINKNQLLSVGDRVIVGFSGGIDSLTLLHFLCNLTEYKLDIWAVYINHSLRPLENVQEEKLLEKVGKEWGIHTHKATVDIPAKLKAKPDSLELVAREERYRIFREFRGQIDAGKVALAHHLDDQVETILYRIIRGTGIDGLSGIPVTRDGFYIRPFLEVTRKEIQEYALSHKLAWLEDSSNREMIYQRNKIRLQLLPLLEGSYNPRIKESLIRLSKLASAQRDYMTEVVNRLLPDLLVSEGDSKFGLKLDEFLKQSFYVQYYILKQLVSKMKANYHLETATLDHLLQKINEEQYHFKTMHIFKGIRVYAQGKNLLFAESQDKTTAMQLRISQSFSLTSPGHNIIQDLKLRIHIENAYPPEDWHRVPNDQVYVAANKLPLPLKIRFWRPGDVFWPLGSPGSQKLHDFFINIKLPRSLRMSVPLLVTSDDQIVWVVGYRLSERFKVDNGNDHVWRLSMAICE